MDITASSACVLCDRPLPAGTGRGPRFGFCASCAGELGMVPAEDLLHLDQAAYDRLPFGFIVLDEHGYVEEYNQAESELSGLSPGRVIGRHFFRDVAPCTAVREFQGRLHDMIAADVPAVARLRYAFRFSGGERLVQVVMAYVPRERRGVLIIRPVDSV